MYAILKNNDVVLYLLSEPPEFKNGYMDKPITALDVKEGQVSIVETDPPATEFVGGMMTLKGGIWSVIDEEAYKLAIKPPVPSVVTKRQAKQQLVLSGLYSQVQSSIDSVVDETERLLVQIYWDDSQEFERNHPQLISLGMSLGLSDSQVDDLFISASKL